MASLKSYIDAPLFYDDTELSATMINIIRDNSEAVKNSSLIPQPAFDIHRVLSVVNNTDVWRGGFQYRTGLTTASFVIYSKEVSGEGEHDIVIYFDGVEMARYDAAIGGYNVGGFHGTNITISGLGYTDYQIITVRVTAEPRAGGGDDDATKGVQYVFDAWVWPFSSVSIGMSWPGLPTFGTLDATKLNQLANASDYLANRLAIIPMPLSMGYIQWMGTNNPKFPSWRYFTARLTNGNRRIKTNVYYICQQTSASIRLTVGSFTKTYGPYTKGQQALIQFDEDLITAGLSFDTDYFSSLTEVVHTPGSNSDGYGGFLFSRIDNGPIRFTANSYSVTTPATTNLMLESLTFSQLQSRLNTISTDLSSSYSRITGNARVFDRATMCRSRYGISAEQSEYWATTFVPSRYREGDVLWVKGQGLKIAYGPVTQKRKSDSKPNDVIEYNFLYEKDLLDGDKVSQQMFYLDQFEGLYPGMRYYIIGKDVIYAAEHLR